jgi:HD superfamily phosphodiesterase
MNTQDKLEAGGGLHALCKVLVRHGFATGHGDNLSNVIHALDEQLRERYIALEAENAEQCSSCGGFCGGTKRTVCLYGTRREITMSERADIDLIVKKWDYATEAAIEAYLLGKSRAR